jgi:hypothetical protein
MLTRARTLVVAFASPLALTLLVAPAAHAQEASVKPTAFGDAGQFALSLQQGVVFNQADFFTGTGLGIAYFAAPHLSLAVTAAAQWLSNDVTGSGNSAVLVHVGPRIGYDVPLSEVVSFWPQVGVDYRLLSQSLSSTNSTGGGASSTTSATLTSTAFGLTALAPLVLHPSKGLFFGAGPTFYTEFSSSTSSGGASADNPKITSVGLMAMIGGAI